MYLRLHIWNVNKMCISVFVHVIFDVYICSHKCNVNNMYGEGIYILFTCMVNVYTYCLHVCERISILFTYMYGEWIYIFLHVCERIHIIYMYVNVYISCLNVCERLYILFKCMWTYIHINYMYVNIYTYCLHVCEHIYILFTCILTYIHIVYMYVNIYTYCLHVCEHMYILFTCIALFLFPRRLFFVSFLASIHTYVICEKLVCVSM